MPAGIAALVACWLIPLAAWASPLVLSVDPDGIQRAQIIVDSYRFTPDHLIVTADAPVELTLKGTAWLIPHNFVLEAPTNNIEASTILREVLPGRTVTVRFTPTSAGQFKFTCDKKLLFFKSHEARGMVGTLEVRGAVPRTTP